MKRRGTFKEGANSAIMAGAFEKHLREVYAWMDGKPHVKALRVAYHDVLKTPAEIAPRSLETGIRMFESWPLILGAREMVTAAV